MRRRFWLSRRSAEVGVGRVAVTVERLQQHLMGRDVYLSSRGYVSTDSHGWRRHVGFVGGVAAAEAGEHWVVEVETTEEYEVRQHEVVGGVTTGRQDLDAVVEEREQELRRRFNAQGFLTSTQLRQAYNVPVDANATLQPGQIVYATSDGTVSATPSRHSPVVGTFLRMEGNNAVVALDGGGAVTMQVDSTATAQNVVAAVQASPAASMLQAAVDAGRSLYAGFRDALIRVGEAASAREDAYRQFTALSYTDRTEIAEVRGTSPLPVSYTAGSYTGDSYTANIPITITNGADDIAATMQRQSREHAAVARRRQDEAAAQALATSRPVRFPLAGPVTDERTQRICDIVERISREAAQRYLGEPIQVDPHTTHITESERRRIEEGVTAALRQRLDGDIRLVVDREMRAGQLQTHIVGSTTGERGFTSSFDSGDVWSRTESRRSSLRGHSADLLVVDDLLEETTPERQEQVEQLYAELARLRPGSVVVAAPATGTVRLTNTSSEAYTIAPGALAVSSSPDAPTTWYNIDETTLPPGGVVEVPVHSMSSEASPSQITHVRSPLPGVVVSPTTQWQQGDIRRLATLSTTTGRDLDAIAEQLYNLDRNAGETDEALRLRCQLQWSQRLPHVVSASEAMGVYATYTVDAVEVSPDPACAPWLPRLLPWLGSTVSADDAELRRLDDEVAATGQQLVLVYVEERRALRVETRREWIAAGGGRMVWSTIRDRAAVLS